MLNFNVPSWYTNFTSGFSHLPFGSIANANYAGNAGMFNPFANPQTNQQAMILEPASFHPQFINLAPYMAQSDNVDGTVQNAVGTLPPPTAQELNPNNFPSVESVIGSPIEWLGEVSKTYFLVMLALALVIMGLYFLAKSTDTGQIVIGAAKEAAMAGA